MMVQRPRIFEDRDYTQPTTPWLWREHDVQLQKVPEGWAVMDGGEQIHTAGTVSAALIVFDQLTEGNDGIEDNKR